MNCPECDEEEPGDGAFCSSCGASLASDSLTPGSLLLQGTYRIESVLGQGGFGITYRAQDNNLHRTVAIKEFFPTGCRRATQRVSAGGTWSKNSYQEARQRFLEEGRTLARFSHPGIVRVFAAFEENESAYIVMELIAGKTLEKLLEQRGRLPEAEALELIRRVGEALEEVHRMDMLHRDIKPPNIILCEDGRIVLVDFGTARQFASGLTSKHSVMLTPGYAPLEQYAERGRRGPYTDVYSLAATLYHLLSGSFPESATDRAAGLPLTGLAELCPEVSPPVVAAVARGMQMDMAQRPQTVAEFLSLWRTTPGEPPKPPVSVESVATPAEAPSPPTQGADKVTPTQQSTAAKTGPPPARSKRSSKAVLVCLVILVGGGLMGSLARTPSTQNPIAMPRPLWNAQRAIDECQKGQQETAAAMKKYAAEHQGRYPQELKQLVPNYVAELPICPVVHENLPPWYEHSSDPEIYTVMCRSNHRDAGIATAYPQIGSESGAKANHPLLSRRPSSAFEFATRGCAFLSLRRLPEALQDFDEARRLESSFDYPYWQSAIALTAMGKPGEALAYLRVAIKMAPDNSDYRSTLVDIFYAQKDLAKVQSELDHLPQNDPMEVAERRCRLLYYQLHFSEVLAATDQGWAKKNVYGASLFKVFCSLAMGDADQVTKSGEQFLHSEGYRLLESSGEVCAYTALAYEMLGQKDQARAFLVTAIPQIRPAWGGPLALYAAGSLDEKALLAEAGDEPGRLTEAHALLGFYASVRGDKAKAREHLTWVMEQGRADYREWPIAKAWLGRL